MDDDWFDGDSTSTSDSTAMAPPTFSVINGAGDKDSGLDVDQDWFSSTPEPEPTAPAPAIAAPRHGNSGRRGMWAVIGAVAALVSLGGAVAAYALNGIGGDTQSTDLGISITSAPPQTTTEPAPTEWCLGLAPGDPAVITASDLSIATIAGFQSAYYERRDAVLARAYAAPTAHMGSVEELAAGIAGVPAGTKHCVLAQKRAPGLYAVDLFTRNPNGGALERYRQTVTTVDDPSGPKGALITSILAREGN